MRDLPMMIQPFFHFLHPGAELRRCATEDWPVLRQAVQWCSDSTEHGGILQSRLPDPHACSQLLVSDALLCVLPLPIPYQQLQVKCWCRTHALQPKCYHDVDRASVCPPWMKQLTGMSFRHGLKNTSVFDRFRYVTQCSRSVAKAAWK